MHRYGARPSLPILGACLGALLLSSAALAQGASLTRDQMRTRILDICVLTLAPKVGPTVAVAPTCSCYARGVLQIMNAEDTAFFVDRRAIPPRLRNQAAAVYAKCGAPS